MGWPGFSLEWEIDQDEAGTCCNTGELCDLTDTDASNDCSDAYFWGDGVADREWIACGGYCPSFNATVYAPARTTISVLPVGNHPDGGLDPGVRIEGNEMIMEKGGRNVWLEIRIGDWDPDDMAVRLRGWQVVIDSSGYTSGLAGTLTPYSPPCEEDGDCQVMLGAGARCGSQPGVGSNNCTPGFIDISRIDSLPAGVMTNLTGLDYAYAGFASPPGVDDPVPFPTEGLYAGTLVLEVPPEAKGAFQVGMRYHERTQLIDQYNQHIRLLRLLPATIIIDAGSCCYSLGSPEEACIEDTTRNECDAMPGPREFTPGGVCTGECPSLEACCLSDGTCVQLTADQCAAEGGHIVNECLGDGDGNGFDDACVSGAIPALSAWGMVVLALSLAVLGKTCFGRRGKSIRFR